MPLKLYRCPKCGAELKTKVNNPTHCDGLACDPILTAPEVKFQEKRDSDRNASALVGQEKILRERARKHSRDVEMDDLIMSNDRTTALQNGWIKPDGQKRKAIDDK
jgi:hypothetical protein